MQEHTKWQSFLSLNWYAGLLSFMFRFVAMTAEPLLAAGVVVSAADFLQKGALLLHDAFLASAWAWTQALAIEASTGPVLVFALTARGSHDRVKAWLYGILASLLFVVGGSMLLLQMSSTVTGFSEAAINPYVLYGLFVLRVIVASGMVALSCTKHMRFSGVDAPGRQSPTQVHIVPQQAGAFLELEAPENESDTFQESTEGFFESKEQDVRAAIAAHPTGTLQEWAQASGSSLKTTAKWAAKWAAKEKEQAS